MNTKITLTPQSYQKLICHLVNFEENKNAIIDEYFPKRTKEREDISRLLTRYLEELDKIIGNITISNDSNLKFPFVIIGSNVVIRDIHRDEEYSYLIGGPYYDTDSNNYVSYLSPVGRALLLQRIGNIISVTTPSGQYQYKIISIEFF